MSAQHTPGPWAVGFSDGSGCADAGKKQGATITAGDHAAVDYICNVVTVVRGGHDDWGMATGVLREADARLIAAAPELLEALTAIRDMWPAHGTTVQNATADAMANRARTALAKVAS